MVRKQSRSMPDLAARHKVCVVLWCVRACRRGGTLTHTTLIQKVFANCGRRAVMTKPYRPLGVPDHTIGERLPEALNPKSRVSKPRRAGPTGFEHRLQGGRGTT